MARWNKTAKWKRARVAEIMARDGPHCWLCGRAIPTAPKKQGRRASIEHLEARCLNGGDELENLVLCHAACNRHLAGRPIGQKWTIREKWRRTAERRAATARGLMERN